MSLIKMISTSLLALGVSCGSMYAQAAASDLTLINNTDHESTAILNNNHICSSWLGVVTHPHDKSTVSASTLDLACGKNAAFCRADVYLTKDCSGPIVGVVYFDITNLGFISRSMNDSSYDIKGARFTVSMDKVG